MDARTLQQAFLARRSGRVMPARDSTSATSRATSCARYGNRYGRTSYLFVGVGDAERGRALAERALRPRSRPRAVDAGKPGDDAERRPHRRRPGRARRRAAADRDLLQEFRDGMAARARRARRHRAQRPGAGSGPRHRRRPTCSSRSTPRAPASLQERCASLREGLDAAGGCRSCTREHAQLLDGAREHFGFADGIRPARDRGLERRAPRRRRARGQRRLAAAGARRVHPRLPRRGLARRPGTPLPSAPATPLGPQRHVHGVAQAASGRARCSARTLREARRLQRGDEADAGGQGGGPLAQRHAAGRLPRAAAARASTQAAPRQRLPLRGRRPRRPRCPIGAHIRRSNPRDALGFDAAS